MAHRWIRRWRRVAGSTPTRRRSTPTATTPAGGSRAIHFPKLIDRFWQNLRRAVGWDVQYFATLKFTTHRDVGAHVARRASGGLRFDDLRHSYATWLVSDGVPVNIVQAVLGHQQASTTLDRYTHAPKDYDDRLRQALGSAADDSLTIDPDRDPGNGDGPSEEGP